MTLKTQAECQLGLLKLGHTRAECQRLPKRLRIAQTRNMFETHFIQHQGKCSKRERSWEVEDEVFMVLKKLLPEFERPE